MGQAARVALGLRVLLMVWHGLCMAWQCCGGVEMIGHCNVTTGPGCCICTTRPGCSNGATHLCSGAFDARCAGHAVGRRAPGDTEPDIGMLRGGLRMNELYAHQEATVYHRFYTLYEMQVNIVWSQTKFVLAKLRRHEVGRHFNTDILRSR
jgi:hypothetical protein